MRARLAVHVPFSIVVPDGSRFNSRPYQIGDYTVIERPPMRSDAPSPPGGAAVIRVDQKSGIETDVLVIDFHKETFDRTQGSRDPPRELLDQAFNSLIARLRYVTRGAPLKPLKLKNRQATVLYTNDDGSELPESGPQVPLERKPIRRHVQRSFQFKASVCNPAVWRDVQKLNPVTFKYPIWAELLLDAEDALPHVGSAVTLGAAALERFIKDILDQLAAKKAKPDGLWTWLVNQEKIDKRPSVEDMFDAHLKLFTGHTLNWKGSKLWEAMMNLKTARNKFVHEGIARVSAKAQPLTTEEAIRLLTQANEITATIRNWLPKSMRWPVFMHTVDVNIAFPVLQTAPASTPQVELESRGTQP